MASVYEVHETTKGDLITSSMDDRGWITYTAQRTFDIVLDTGIDDNSVTVRINAALPRFRDPHPSSLALRVDDVKVNRETVILYKAIVSYKSSKAPEGTDPNESPLNLPVDIKWAPAKSEREITEDADGNAIVNDGTDERIYGVMRPFTDLQATLTKNFLLFNPVSIYLFNDRVNSDTFLGFPPGVAKIESITADSAVADDLSYFVTTMVVLFRAPYQTTAEFAWYHRELRRGFQELKAGKVIQAVDDEKKPVTVPILLKADGSRLPTGDPPEFKLIKKFSTLAFNSLGFL
jgi:hypothetical protein